MTKDLLFVSRPGAPGKQLAAALQKHGLMALHTPSLEIQAIDTDLPSNHYDIAIFISPTSVQASFQFAPKWLDNTATLIAVGPGTAQALHDHGYSSVLVPETANSEGLLAMSELRLVERKEIVIVKGVGGRPLLEETLLARGATCIAWSVYRRVPAEIPATAWDAYAKAESRELTCASIETLDAFEAQRLRHNLSKPEQIYVASERIADHARAVGYTGIIQVGGATNDHFMAAIKLQHS